MKNVTVAVCEGQDDYLIVVSIIKREEWDSSEMATSLTPEEAKAYAAGVALLKEDGVL